MRTFRLSFLLALALASQSFAQEPSLDASVDHVVLDGRLGNADVAIVDAGAPAAADDAFKIGPAPYIATDTISFEGFTDDVVGLAKSVYDLLFVQKKYAAGVVGIFLLLFAALRRYGANLPAPVGPFFLIPAVQTLVPSVTVVLLTVFVALVKGIAGWALVQVIVGAFIFGVFLTLPGLKSLSFTQATPKP